MSDAAPTFVRTATVDDLDTVSRLLSVTWHHTYDELYGSDEVARITSSWHSVAALRKQIEAPQSEFVVADTGERIVGMGYARRTDGATVNLSQLYVEPSAQRRGVGGALLDELISCFPEAKRMTVEVAERNENALGFYRHVGFKQVGAVSENGVETCVLERPLHVGEL